MKTMETDILLICKNWYNREKYKYDMYNAFKAYYEAYYNDSDVPFSKELCLQMFLKPTIVKFADIAPKTTINKLLCQSYAEDVMLLDGEHLTYEDKMYERCIICLRDLIVKNVDLVDYQEMFEKAKETHYKDHTIGVI